MSILVRFHPANLTAEKYDEIQTKLDAAGWPPEGLEHHVCFDTGSGLTVSEIWGSRELFQVWGETVLPILTEGGIEMSGEPEIHEVYRQSGPS
jgi:hypothetical protein